MNLRPLVCASTFVVCSLANAQTEQDALLYSSVGSGGTARTLAMAGSFGAIGADPSAALINPGGIATLRRSEFSMGFQFLNVKSTGTYLGNSVTDGRLNFNIPTMNMAVAKVFYDTDGKPKKTGLANLNFGFHINQLASFNSRMSFDGLNTSSSITDYFAKVATDQQSLPGDLYLGYLESIAYSAGAIENLHDQFNNETTIYVSRYIDSNRKNQQTGTQVQKGGIYEYQYSMGANFSHKVYLGLGLMYTSLRLNNEYDLSEVDKQQRANPDLQQVDYSYNYIDHGGGFGAKLGAIFRPNDQLRLGVAIHTPKTYSITTNFRYDVTSTFEPGANIPSVVRAYTDGFNNFTYKVTTPARVITSVGFVINKAGLINADLEFYNYASARMKSTDYAYVKENNLIRTEYKNVVILRLGGELNFPDKNNKDAAYRLRGGFASYPSPFSSNLSGIDNILKKSRNIYSTGFGYREKNYYLDFALTYATSSNYFTPYITGTSLFPVSSVTQKKASTGISFTMGFNLD